MKPETNYFPPRLIKDAKSETMPAPLDLQEPMEINKTEGKINKYENSTLIKIFFQMI